jgi:hypothetical protein
VWCRALFFDDDKRSAEYTTIVCRKPVRDILKRDSWNAVVFFRVHAEASASLRKVLSKTLSQINRLICVASNHTALFIAYCWWPMLSHRTHTMLIRLRR